MSCISDFIIEDDVLMKYTGNDTEVAIPDCVKSIGTGAFEYCSSVVSVCIPDSVTSIEFWAFHMCTALTTVQIPNSVEKISHGVFDGCAALSQIHLPPSVTRIDSRTFKNCVSLVEISIPDSVTEIHEDAFSGCTSLSYVRIPNSVTRIYQAAFSGCTALTDIVIPESVTHIGAAAFFGCSALRSIYIPKNVREINNSAFIKTNLTSISVDPGNPYYHSSGNCLIRTGARRLIAVGENSIIPLDATVKYIASRVFWGLQKEFAAPELPDAIVDMEHAFACSRVQSVIVPRGVRRLVYGEFVDCEALESVVIPASVTEIEQTAFEGCKKISHLEIYGTPKISPQSFENIKLTCFRAPELVAANGFSWWRERFGEHNTYLAAFENFDPESKIAKYAKKCYEDAFAALLACDRVDLLPAFLSMWKTVESKVFDLIYKAAKRAKKAEFIACLEDWKMQTPKGKDVAAATKKETKPKTTTPDGKNFEISRGVLKQYKGRSGTVVIPETVTKIGEKAFKDCVKIKKVVLHDGVTEIQTAAFFGCSSLKEMTIGKGVTRLGKAAFWDCKGLENLFIPATVTGFGACVFAGCDSLTISGYANSKAEKYAKENGIKFERIDSE